MLMSKGTFLFIVYFIFFAVPMLHWLTCKVKHRLEISNLLCSINWQNKRFYWVLSLFELFKFMLQVHRNSFVVTFHKMRHKTKPACELLTVKSWLHNMLKSFTPKYFAGIRSSITFIIYKSKYVMTKCTFVANLSELTVSEKCSSLGDTFTNIRVLLLPPREFCKRYVSLLFRYGTWFS